MSGVRVGTRLQQLRELERAVKVQIEVEERNVLRGLAAQAGSAYPSLDVGPTAVAAPAENRAAIVRVPFGHVAGPAIRAWARAHRYDVTSRGRLDDLVIGAYVEAHQ